MLNIRTRVNYLKIIQENFLWKKKLSKLQKISQNFQKITVCPIFLFFLWCFSKKLIKIAKDCEKISEKWVFFLIFFKLIKKSFWNIYLFILWKNNFFRFDFNNISPFVVWTARFWLLLNLNTRQRALIYRRRSAELMSCLNYIFKKGVRKCWF